MATEVTTVQMTDGRTVEFRGSKRRIIKSPFIDGDKLGVRFDFLNGQTRTFILPESLVQQFALHGAAQKIGDAAAGAEELDDIVAEIDEEIARLSRGDWTSKRERGTAAGKASILAQALVEVTGKTQAEVVEFLSTKSHKEKLALRNLERIKAVCDRLEAERAAKRPPKEKEGVDASALLAELGDGAGESVEDAPAKRRRAAG